jgi:histidine triad (HIT) family protein
MTAPAGCVFCEIVAGTRPAHVVFRDEVATAFLDARPVFPGHTLLVPLEHHETLPDLPSALVGPLFRRARHLSGVVTAALGAAGSFVAVNNRISQSVPHLHVHVVPRNPKDGLRGFFWPRTRYADSAEAAGYAERLRAAWGSGPDRDPEPSAP